MDLNNLINIYKEKNPMASDEEAKQGILSFLQTPDMAPTKPAEPVSSFDVPVSDNTVTQNGAPESLPHATTLDQNMLEVSQDKPDMMEPPMAPATAPTVPMVEPAKAMAKGPMPSVAKTISSPEAAIFDTPAKDNEARNAMLADQEHKKKLGIIPSIAGGIADTIGGAAASFGGKGASGVQDEVMKNQRADEAQNKQDFELGVQNDPNSDVSKSYRQMVLQIAPDLASNPNFTNMSAKAIGDRLPLIDTMMKARAAEDAKKMGMEQLKANKEVSLGLKENQQQDKLESQAMQRLQTLRGDQSLARIENQRDAAISAYRLLDSAKTENRPLSQAEYYDVLGQLWKARSGSSPTDAAIRDLDSKTFKGDLNKAATYFTGKPAGATTQGVLDNLLQFVRHTGELADEQHDAYMAPHLIKPKGLEDERWQPIVKTNRGTSFMEATKPKQSTPSHKDPLGILQ